MTVPTRPVPARHRRHRPAATRSRRHPQVPSPAPTDRREGRPRRSPLRRPAVVAVALLAAALLAACGAATPTTQPLSLTPHNPPTVAVAPAALQLDYFRDLHAWVLADGGGYALYIYAPDQQRAVTCTADCALTWPPLTVPSAHARPRIGAGVDAALVGVDPGPGGTHVVTYNGWPLYSYVGDGRPGEASGQGISLNGGLWYVMRASGTPLVPAGLPVP